LWNLVIRIRQLRRMTPLLEAILSRVSSSGFDSVTQPTPAVPPVTVNRPETTGALPIRLTVVQQSTPCAREPSLLSR
jgi:hypothetical protein